MNVVPDLRSPICLASAQAFLLNYEEGMPEGAILSGIEQIRSCSAMDKSFGNFDGENSKLQASEQIIQKLNGILAQALAMN